MVESADSHKARAVPPQAGSNSCADSADSQAVSASPQAISIASQAVNNSQAGTQLNNNSRQAVSTNIISTSQAGRQAGNSSTYHQADSTNSQGASAAPPGRQFPGRQC